MQRQRARARCQSAPAHPQSPKRVSVCAICVPLHQLKIELLVAKENFVPVVAKGPLPTADSCEVLAVTVYLPAHTLAIQEMTGRTKAMVLF